MAFTTLYEGLNKVSHIRVTIIYDNNDYYLNSGINVLNK